MQSPIIAIDLGGTNIKVAIVQGQEILVADSIPSHSSEGLAPQLPRLEDFIRKLCSDQGISPSDCAGVGMAVPFMVDPVACKVTSAPNDKFFDACEIDLPAWVRERFGLEFKIENDAHAACLGEWRYGAGAGVDDLVMFTLGTGIGCSVILRGRPLRGKRFQAGVCCGHLISDPYGAPCTCCPADGCYESLSASRALDPLARSHPDFTRSSLASMELIDFKAIFEQAATGDITSLYVRDRVIRYWSALAVNICAAYDPDRIVYGGAVAAAAPVILPAIRDYVARHAWTVRPPDIFAASLGNNAGTVGIASLFYQETTIL